MSVTLLVRLPAGNHTRRGRRIATPCLLAALLAGFSIAPRSGLAQAVFSQAAPAGTATTLQRAVAEALKNNPEIRAARREREAASQRVAPAGALEDPMLEAGVVSLPTNSFSFNREDMTMKMLGVSQRFPYPGKRALRTEIATQEAQTSAYGYQETLNRVAREVSVAYYDLYLVLESSRLVEKNKGIVEQFLRIAETRYSVGQGSQADVLKAQTQLSKMIEELIKLGRERPMFEAELNRALGRNTGTAPIIPDAPRLHELSLSLPALTDAALRQRPQLLGLQSTIARNEKMLAMARKEYYPDFDVRLAYGQRDNMPDGTRRSDLVNFTVAINLPIWRANKLAPRVTEAEAMREQATDMYQAMRNEIGMKLRQQVAIAEQSRRAVQLYQTELLPQARLSVEAALAAYRVNRVDFLTLLDNQMTVFNAEIGYTAALVDHNKALAEIDFVTGKPVQTTEHQ